MDRFNLIDECLEILDELEASSRFVAGPPLDASNLS